MSLLNLQYLNNVGRSEQVNLGNSLKDIHWGQPLQPFFRDRKIHKKIPSCTNFKRMEERNGVIDFIPCME